MTNPQELYACLYIREFPAQAMLRLRPELRYLPCVVMDGEPPLQQVCSLNSKARNLGVTHGMTQVELDTFPSVSALPRSQTEEATAKIAMLECAGSFSPRVEDLSGDDDFICVIDISGTEKLHGPAQKMGKDLIEHVRSLGVVASVAVSSNFHTAIFIARGRPSRYLSNVIPQGEEKTALRSLPLTVLDLPERLVETFFTWGIYTLGMLAALPERELIARLGQEGKRLRLLARGEHTHLFMPVEPVFSLEEKMELDMPVELLDSLLFVIRLMLEQLILRATARILALASVTVTLSLEGGLNHTRTVRPALPTNDIQVWIKLIHLDLEAHPPQAAILSLVLSAEPGATSKVQMGLFSPQLPEPTRLDVTLARIRAIVGEDNVGSAVLKDTHQTDGFRLEPFVVPTGTSTNETFERSRGALRKLRPAESTMVILRGQRPETFLFREKRYTVENAYGPWLASSDWWTSLQWNVEQWDLVARSQDGTTLCCCLVRDPLANDWHMVAFYDPVGMELLFERFLSESRGEWPDIDLDLPSEEKREKAIQYVYQRYGELGAAMTANVISYRGKSAAREVGKALGFDQESLGRLSNLVGNWEWRGKTDTMAHSFQNAGFDVKHPRIAKYLELCVRIQDLPRHLGQHSGGMVICQGYLNQVVPLERASMPGRTVVQWDKEDCADLGIIKVDLLGLGMMAVIKDCLELIPDHYGEKIDLAQLPEDDEVYRTLQKADTVGMFQVESRAQMASLPRNMPTKFYDLVVQVAIIRPGPIVGKMMHPYMRRRQKKEDITYPHPSLEPVLKRTLGVPLFQEQLLRMAMTVANFSGAEAEELRRAVGMRRSWERMKNLEGKLRTGMTANGIGVAVQDTIIENISSFALYGFPESHAASFALIAYASAYFKVKYLAAFTCAILNNQPMGFYMPAVLMKDAQRHGLRVKPVDVQVSEWFCTIEHEADRTLSLRMGLGYTKGLKRQTTEALVESRKRAGLFQSAEDLALRVPLLNRKDLTLLARIGALNKLEGITHRRDALWQVERAGKLEGPLLQQQSEWLRDDTETQPLQQMSTEERLVADYAGTGLTTGKHPMFYRRSELRERGVLSANELRARTNGEFVRTAGCIIARQRPGTAKGFIFLSMEDETGIANVIITPDLYEREKLLVTRAKFLLVEGSLQSDSGVIHVKATRLTAVSDSALELRSHDFH